MLARETSGNSIWEPPFITDPKLTSSSRTAGLSDTVKVSAIAWPTAASAGSQTWVQSAVETTCVWLTGVPADPRLFVGLPASAPRPVVAFLQEQGYIVDMADTAARCAIYLEAATLDRMTKV